jgi:hypothetical protein
MRTTKMIISALALLATGRGGLAAADPTAATTATATRTTTSSSPSPGKKLFFDFHDLGAGGVKAKDVAAAHKKDLATQGQYGVAFKAYWVDEKAGKIYCLAEAPSAEAANVVHKQAHGLVASKVVEVTADSANWSPTPGMKLYMDVHHLGAGKVTAADVAAAHKKDLAVGARHDVKYLNYWLDAASGNVMCLSEAPSAEAAVAVHREAHGLIPDTIGEVFEGR